MDMRANIALVGTVFLISPITRIITGIPLPLLLVFTRHHIIDWNYHPAFPINSEIVPIVGLFNTTRNPPISEEIPSKSFPGFATRRSFGLFRTMGKEFLSFVNQQTKYLVLRKALPCPVSLHKLIVGNSLPGFHDYFKN
jgi:hypothetical protein